MWGALQNRGVTGGGEGISAGVTLFPTGRQRVTGSWIEDPAGFCRKMAAIFGAEVYRNSSDDSALGKSAAKVGNSGFRRDNDTARRRTIPKHLRVQVLARDSYRCLMCGVSSSQGARLHVDHIRPVVTGGTDELDNLGTLCDNCNLGKGTHTFRNYRELPFAATSRPDSKFTRWQAIRGKLVQIEPLIGHPGWQPPIPESSVTDVTSSEIRLFKPSSGHNVVLPLSCLSHPWERELGRTSERP